MPIWGCKCERCYWVLHSYSHHIHSFSIIGNHSFYLCTNTLVGMTLIWEHKWDWKDGIVVSEHTLQTLTTDSQLHSNWKSLMKLRHYVRVSHNHNSFLFYEDCTLDTENKQHQDSNNISSRSYLSRCIHMQSWWTNYQSHKSLNSFADKNNLSLISKRTIERQYEAYSFCVCAPFTCNCWWVAVENLFVLKVPCRDALLLFLHRFLVWHLA